MITFLWKCLGISRDHQHKRRATGGKRKPIRKKRKFELGRPPANTKVRNQWLWPTCSSTLNDDPLQHHLSTEKNAELYLNLNIEREFEPLWNFWTINLLNWLSLQLGAQRIHTVRVRGGNKKYRALRLDQGNFSWGSEGEYPFSIWQLVANDVFVRVIWLLDGHFPNKDKSEKKS